MAVGLIGALEARYPVSRRIAGDDLFRAMARAFMRAHKPRSPVMIAYGEDFPEFAAAYLAAAGAGPAVAMEIVIARSEATRRSRDRRPALHPWTASLALAMATTIRLSFMRP